VPKLKPSELRKLKDVELREKLLELRREYQRILILIKKGTATKEKGLLRNVRRNIARVLTEINARRARSLEVEEE